MFSSREHVPLAAVVLSNVVTTQSGRRSRSSCLAGVAEFDGPQTADAADRARHARHERVQREKAWEKKLNKADQLTRKEEQLLVGEGGAQRAASRAERETQRLLRMSDITDVLVRRRARPDSD